MSPGRAEAPSLGTPESQASTAAGIWRPEEHVLPLRPSRVCGTVCLGPCAWAKPTSSACQPHSAHWPSSSPQRLLSHESCMCISFYLLDPFCQLHSVYTQRNIHYLQAEAPGVGRKEKVLEYARPQCWVLRQATSTADNNLDGKVNGSCSGIFQAGTYILIKYNLCLGKWRAHL